MEPVSYNTSTLVVISPFAWYYVNSLLQQGGCEVIFHKRAFPCICAGCLISATVRGQRGEERDSDLYIKLWPARSAGGRRVCCSTAAALVGRSRSVSSSMLKVWPPCQLATYITATLMQRWECFAQSGYVQSRALSKEHIEAKDRSQEAESKSMILNTRATNKCVKLVLSKAANVTIFVRRDQIFVFSFSRQQV